MLTLVTFFTLLAGTRSTSERTSKANPRIAFVSAKAPSRIPSLRRWGQRKRWAKGAVQILLMKNESEVDPDWRPPRVPAPDPKPSLTFPRKMFFYDSVLVPVRFAAGVVLRGDCHLLLVHG
ncbi:hypothetical protein PINS_up006897 [Pythium insidiosum]|nr:hypothetical protein PINS_up006897 [Pythium insidiosum]